jgi:thiol-disulfide isomerase/thioredoxin
MTAGVIALIAALAVGVAGGGIWRRTNGRMRNTVPARGHAPAGQAARSAAADQVVGDRAVPVRTSAAADADRSADADLPPEVARAGTALAGSALAGTALAGTGGAGLSLSSDDVGHPLGGRATLLQFSSAFCAPCRATRRILADVAGMTEGVAHVEIDAESRLDLVRQLNVLRTPTVLVLAGDGTIVRRASGQPRKPDVIAAIGAAVDYNSHINDRDSR